MVVLLGLGIVLAIALVSFGGLGASPMVTVAVWTCFYVILWLLMCAAINVSRRYRMSRTSWRALRFSFHGERRTSCA